MSFKSTALIARKSIRARIGRLIAIAIAILVGVSFVVGSFVLADSLRNTFDDLFTQISENVDLEVRSSAGLRRRQRGPPARPDPGRRSPTRSPRSTAWRRPSRCCSATPSSSTRTASRSRRRARRRSAWPGPATRRCPGWRSRARAGRRAGPTRWPSTRRRADREDFVVGDTIEVITDTGTHTFTITALVGLGDSDGFAGATLAAWDVPTAQQVTGAGRRARRRRRRRRGGVDLATVAARIEEILPERTEVVTSEVADRGEQGRVDTFISAFGNGLLIFAFVTAFVSAFLINNVFAITIGQRLRELALMRAVGATGRQVRRMIYLEALVMSIIATILGIGGGIVVARRSSPSSTPPGRLPRQRHRAPAAHGRHRLPRRRRHHAAVGRSSRPAGRPRSRRSRRCVPSSASRR